ncbi:MAG: 23S rRNA (adenine(2503)-C(2))-methyltransferase RlmN [Prevotella sp.]|jgi:23S rRNA (adenine2503-C2)-methyltransferase|nr:23S rRNA (adenine(2503)-C(2))-methyltransferase RlmN [Prevotella sp.]
MAHRTHLLGMTLNELEQVVSSRALPKFTAKQIADWLYKKRVTSIDEMTNISAANRSLLSVKYNLGRSSPVEKHTSSDGTVKYLFRAKSGGYVETVMIPDGDRMTLCVSSQVGCKLNCLFCKTGKQGFNGNLTAGEMLNQIFSVEDAAKLSNVVFMGMGEPLDNYKQLSACLEIMTSAYGLAWSPKRITVSTTGVVPNLQRFLKESGAHLAISLHSPFHEQRMSLMPVEKVYSMEAIMDVLRRYDWTKQRRLSFEYIMFNGLNDSLRHAKELLRLLKGLECRVNLLRFHSIPEADLRPSDQLRMEQFRNYLTANGIICTVRNSRGEDILAACGMLSTEKEKKNLE